MMGILPFGLALAMAIGNDEVSTEEPLTIVADDRTLGIPASVEPDLDRPRLAGVERQAGSGCVSPSRWRFPSPCSRHFLPG